MAEVERGSRSVAIGIVTRDKMDKTRRVEIARLVKHPRYGKYVRRRTICYVHDANNESHNGDTVEIMESRPMSKNKNWRLVRVVTKAPEAVTLESRKKAARDAQEAHDAMEQSAKEKAGE